MSARQRQHDHHHHQQQQQRSMSLSIARLSMTLLLIVSFIDIVMITAVDAASVEHHAHGLEAASIATQDVMSVTHRRQHATKWNPVGGNLNVGYVKNGAQFYMNQAGTCRSEEKQVMNGNQQQARAFIEQCKDVMDDDIFRTVSALYKKFGRAMLKPLPSNSIINPIPPPFPKTNKSPPLMPEWIQSAKNFRPPNFPTL
jgi:hypothetical protein